jgi:hypothetical protein
MSPILGQVGILDADLKSINKVSVEERYQHQVIAIDSG